MNIKHESILLYLNMSKTKASKTNYAIPGKPMEQHEFEQMVKDAESGNFHSVKTVREEMEKWKAKYSK